MINFGKNKSAFKSRQCLFHLGVPNKINGNESQNFVILHRLFVCLFSVIRRSFGNDRLRPLRD